MTTNPAASTLTPKCSAIPSTDPEGLEEASVAFTTRKTETTVIYHRRRSDQFFGFSMSLGAKSSSPLSLRNGFSEASRALERYGFAVARDSNLPSLSIELDIMGEQTRVK